MENMEQLEAAVQALTEVAGTRLLGSYLSGSAVAGSLRPASDLDVFAVIESPLTDSERTELAGRLMGVSRRRATRRPVECTVVVASDVNPWHYPARVHFVYGDWLARDVAQGHVREPVFLPDLAIQITQVLSSGRVLAGAPARELLAPVPAADLVRASREAIPGLLDDVARDERNVALTFARIWCTIATGEILSKDRAADWATPLLPPQLRPVLEYARYLYLTTSYADETWPDGLRERVSDLVDYIVAEVSADPTRA
jgi:streptomycin 3"-adenylyltransferase